MRGADNAIVGNRREMAEKMKNTKFTKEQEERRTRILEEKRKEFYAKKRYRRLSYSTKELQLLLPFIQLLELSGFYDIHLIHGTTEFGRIL